MKALSKSETEQKLEEARKEIEHYKRIAEQTGNLFLRETETLSKLILWRNQAEKALRESEERFRNVYETAPLAFVVWDLDTNVTDWNKKAEELFGWTKEEVIGNNFFDFLIPEKDRPRVVDVVNSLLNGKLKSHSINDNLTKGGEIITCEWNNSLLHDNDGNIIGVISLGLDITERKRVEEEKTKLEAQLQRAQRLESIGTLASGFAHNFNNLLMGIMANISIMLLDIDSDHQHYKYLKNIEKQIINGSKLAGQLTGYARVGKYEVKPIDLNKLLKETSNTFKIAKKDIRIHKYLTENLYKIEADIGQIEQAILNLFVNAADAMPEGGELFIETKNVTDKDIPGKPYHPKPGSYVLLTIKDTGIGMDKMTRERIFEPFFTTKSLAEGTGLGLSSTYGIIKGHGGYIGVDSEKGHGATFRLYLPATEKDVKKEKRAPDKIVKGKETILFVDDESTVIEGCEGMLNKMGYNVSIAGSGKEALEIYKRKSDEIDMVILDMIMPEMSGGETYDRLKEMNPDIKVLLASGYSIKGQATEILKRGCNGFIQKPFNMEALSMKIREILDIK
ncbi:MAG: PAS domain S-box protein [Desulfobacteraceae bacterium]|nr:PAS domain S-box protein [Desulfobacteraceae bacterium]